MKKTGERRMAVRDITYIAFCTTLIAICAWIKVPFVIPFTLQSFGVYFAVGFLGGKRALISILLYILLGAIGFPVFSGFAGGIGVLFGNTGGYILGFLAPPILACMTVRKSIPLLLGTLLCYSLGTFWYACMYTQNFTLQSLISILSVCVAPFILPDLLKMALAHLLVKRLKKHIK